MSLESFSLHELKKGFFPHTFNNSENQDYIGKFPEKKYFGSEYFSEKKKQVFDAWYEQNCNNIYNFQEEIHSYCFPDVKLLKESLVFRRVILNITNNEIDPFLESIIIASLCHLIFRKKIMQPDTISIIPELGYNPEQITSRKLLQLLKYLSLKNNLSIQHAKNGGEKMVGTFLLDGFSKETKNIFEFHGCFWHGCQKCLKIDTWNPIKREMMFTTNKRHQSRMKYIRENMPNYKIIEKWECEFENDKKIDTELDFFIKNICNISEAINPRDALFGGRTNAFKLYYKCKNGEKIKYCDFTSLYPYVQKYCSYPLGHPFIITENFGNIFDYYGLIKCKIVPPHN